VVNFFRVLRDGPAELVRACRLTAYARGPYLADAEDEPDASDLERARRLWARCTQSFNSGGAGRRAGWAISAAPGSNEAWPTAGLAAQLEAIAGRLSGVYVENADALDSSPATTTRSTNSLTTDGTAPRSGSPSPAPTTAPPQPGTPRLSGATGPIGDSAALFPFTRPENRDETTATGPTRVS